MSEEQMNSYRLTSMEKHGDEHMAQILREVPEEARESTRRAVERLLAPSLPPSHKYYWRNLISRHHISRMLRLAPLDQLMGDVNGVPDSRYLMYRVTTLLSPDGARRYEFLIEYDIYNPSQGIYFGCKSVTVPEYRHSKEIKLANEDWQRVKPHVLLRLNNIFIDKDFTYRFKDTDNANDNTFWPFWITLYEEEDVPAFAVKVLTVIATAYRQLFAGTLPPISKKTKSDEKNIVAVRTAFTDEAYNRLHDSIISSVKINTTTLSPESTILSRPQEAWILFEAFLVEAERQSILHRVEYYEKAWILDSRYSDIDFKCLMTLLFNRISEQLNINSVRIPWSNLIAIFLRSDGTPFKQQIKTLSPTPSTRRFWTTLLQNL